MTSDRVATDPLIALGNRASSPALVARALREPRTALRVGMAILRGQAYKAYYRLIRKRVTFGRGFRVFGSLNISGKGEVIFGDCVSISGHVTPWTHSREARITIGHHTALDAVRFGCKKEITIGDACMIAECRIMDTDFHSTRIDRRVNEHAPARVAAVRVGNNVWVGLTAGLLPGTVIGDNSVVSFGAVCAREYPANSVIMGNPARVVSTVQGAEFSTAPILPERVGTYRPPRITADV